MDSTLDINSHEPFYRSVYFTSHQKVTQSEVSMWPPSELEPFSHLSSIPPSSISLRLHYKSSERTAARSTTSTSVQTPQPTHSGLTPMLTVHGYACESVCSWNILTCRYGNVSFYLPLALSSLTLTSPLVSGFLQSSVLDALLELSSFLQVGRSVSHDFLFLLLLLRVLNLIN